MMASVLLLQDLQYQVGLRLQIHPTYDYLKQRPVIQPHLLKFKRTAALKNCKQRKCWDSRYTKEWLLSEDNVETKRHSYEEKRATCATAEKPNSEVKLDVMGKNISGLKNESQEGKNVGVTTIGAEGYGTVGADTIGANTHGTVSADTQDTIGANTHGTSTVSADTHSVTTVDAETIIDLPGVFDYVNIKYGTSRTQLRNLLEKGCYDTVRIDSSGLGSGPNIKCPVEAHVNLPTPNHKTFESTQSNMTAMGVSCDGQPVSEENPSNGTLVYERGKETKPISTRTLQFESRFECGNLMQAFEL